MTLADSSAWIEFLRDTGSDAHLRLRDGLRNEEVVTNEAVVMELLAGARDGTDERVLRRTLASVPLVPVGGLDAWETAAAISRACRGAGMTIASRLDCLIAAVAIREDLGVLHADRDFDRIAACVPLRIADGD
ncbi:MAG: PIN domain-containing protein [Solirubrobacterales bacterium]|nr:PIN domain-containing protein [Solirubrobacterales bacterium]